MMKSLHLVLKTKWYDMIDCGEKKEEYREIKPYWIQRLIGVDKLLKEGKNLLIHEIPLDYDHVTFHKGYTSTTMTFDIESIEIGRGNPEWGAPEDKDVFIIKLGNRQNDG